jgi:DNA polymerase III subunit delta
MIVFLYGLDTFRSGQKLKEIIASYENAYQGKVRSFYFDCENASVDEVRRVCETVSLFEQKKLIVLRNVFRSAPLVEWVKDHKEALHKSGQYVLVLFETEEIKAKNKHVLYRWLVKHAKCQEFLPFPPAKLQIWIAREFQRYGMSCVPRAQELLARSIGSDLWRLTEEIKKVVAFKQPGVGQQVKEADVALFLDIRAEAAIFTTIEEVSQRNRKQAISLMYRHIQNGDTAHYLFSMFVYQFRNILVIRDLVERGMSRAQIVRETKLHPYVVQKGMRVAEKFSTQNLMDVYQNLFVIEKNLKTGRVNAEAALDLFVATL